MTVHVIIPVYNAREYLQSAVMSVLKQPFKSIDITLIDDGSTDGSSALCDQLAAAEERVTVVHQENKGVSSARNAGIEYILQRTPPENYVNRDYIAFLDADDLWADDFMSEETVALLSKGYDLVGFQSCHCNNTATRRDQPCPLEAGIYHGGAKYVWIHSTQHFGAMLYSVRLLDTYPIRFFDGLKYSEDKIFIMQSLYLATTVWLENRLMYYYRRVSSSAMRSRKYGIPYFVPIIDAWLKSDTMMEQYKTEERGFLKEGRVLAAIYVVDMIEEHYQHFEIASDVDVLLRNKPEYVALVEEKFANSAVSGLRWKAMKMHPIVFRMKCFTKGIVLRIRNIAWLCANKIPAIAKQIEKMRYSVPL